MEKIDGILHIKPVHNWRDLHILRTIADGLEMRQQEGKRSEDEDHFSSRVDGALKEVDAGQWNDQSDFPLSPNEAWFAVYAIKTKGNAELRQNTGHLVERQTILADAVLPRLEDYAKQAA